MYLFQKCKKYIYAFAVTFLLQVMEELAGIGINSYKMSEILRLK